GRCRSGARRRRRSARSRPRSGWRSATLRDDRACETALSPQDVPPTRTLRPGVSYTPGPNDATAAKRRASLHLNVQFLGEQVKHFLTDTALGPLVGRLHRLL